MLMTSTIPNLINGISQQPPTLRLASQAEDQVNFLSSVADGLTVRPPSRHLAMVDNADWADAFIHTINRDVTERYIVAIRSGQLRVFEANTGIERTVTAPNGWGYLSSFNADDYRAVTVADYTFILNRNKTVAVDPAKTPDRINEALIYIRGGNYGKTYRLFVDDIQCATFTTPNGSDAAHTSQIDTNYIASRLLASWNSYWSAAPEGFVMTQKGDVLSIKRINTLEFSVRAEDGTGGVNIVAIQSQVQRFSDLPEEGVEGFDVEVVGDQSSSFDNYFVRFEAEGIGGVGVWKEHLKGGETFRMDASTMPHTLVRNADGTFTFDAATWADREVGDLDKVPHPSFTTRKIRDIFFFQNRLGFVADENVITSQDGEYFDFYRSTATSLRDTDPIDVAVTSERVSILNFAVPFNRTLLLFSDQSQFVLEGGGTLTPQTVSVAQATAFESLTNVRPVGVGQFVYFPVPRGSFSGLREYFVQEGNEQNDALDVTSHAPRYLPRSLTQLAASSSEDTLVCLASGQTNAMWIYRFFFNNEGKLQSAWSKWEFGADDNILSVSFIESSLYMVVSRYGQTFLERVNLESGSTDEDSVLQYRIDRGITEALITSVIDGDYTNITLPFGTTEETIVMVRGGDLTHDEGIIVNHEQIAPNQLRLRGDWTGVKLLIGTKYVATYQFSTFYLRSQEPGGGVTADSAGRLQLRYLSIDFSRAGFFKITSKPRGRDTYTKTFTGRQLGVESGTIGRFNLPTGRVRVPIMARNVDALIKIVCDSPLPASFTAAEWEATYSTRSRKV